MKIHIYCREWSESRLNFKYSNRVGHYTVKTALYCFSRHDILKLNKNKVYRIQFSASKCLNT